MRKDYNGESQETPTKQEQFVGFLRMQMMASKSIIGNNKHHWINKDYYQYFDLYAGSGTWGNGQPGSPLIFLQAIEECDIPYQAVFIDKDTARIAALRDLVPSHHRQFCQFIAGDNKLAMRPWLRATKEKPRMGLVYADPYGAVCWDLLAWLSRVRRFERTDFLVYFPANRGLKGPRRRFPERFDYLTEYLEAIDKQRRLIRRPRTGFEWVFVYLTRWANMPEWRHRHWYDLDTDEGRKVLYRCNFTAEERQELNSNGQERLPGL